MWFFSQLIWKKGSRIQGFKGSSAFLPYPSAMLLGTEIAALLICDVGPYLSLLGNFLILSDYAYQVRRDKCNS